MKLMGKTTITFERMKFRSVTTKLTVLCQNVCCKYRKQDRVIDTSFRLRGEFYTENAQGYFCGIC